MSEKSKYPLWLNVWAGAAFLGVPVGFYVAVAESASIGTAILVAAFLSLPMIDHETDVHLKREEAALKEKQND